MWCYTNALFHMVKACAGTIAPIQANAIFYFKNETNRLTLDRKCILPEDEIFSDMGIKLKNVKCECGIIEKIMTCIDNKGYAIIPIDSFYYPIRKDSFNIVHCFHCVHVFGYDESTQYFQIIDHSYVDSSTYIKQGVSFRDMENSYFGHVKLLDDTPMAQYMEIYHKGQIKKEENYVMRLRNNYIKGASELKAGLLALDEFILKQKAYFRNEQIFFENINESYEIFTRLIVAIKVRNYDFISLQVLSDTQNIILENILASWSLAFGLITKTKFTRQITQKSFLKYFEQVEKAAKNEKCLAEILYPH